MGQECAIGDGGRSDKVLNCLWNEGGEFCKFDDKEERKFSSRLRNIEVSKSRRRIVESSEEDELKTMLRHVSLQLGQNKNQFQKDVLVYACTKKFYWSHLDGVEQGLFIPPADRSLYDRGERYITWKRQLKGI